MWGSNIKLECGFNNIANLEYLPNSIKYLYCGNNPCAQEYYKYKGDIIRIIESYNELLIKEPDVD